MNHDMIDYLGTTRPSDYEVVDMNPKKPAEERKRQLNITVSPETDAWLRSRPSLSAGRAAAQCIDLVRRLYGQRIEALEARGCEEPLAVIEEVER